MEMFQFLNYESLYVSNFTKCRFFGGIFRHLSMNASEADEDKLYEASCPTPSSSTQLEWVNNKVFHFFYDTNWWMKLFCAKYWQLLLSFFPAKMRFKKFSDETEIWHRTKEGMLRMLENSIFKNYIIKTH